MDAWNTGEINETESDFDDADLESDSDDVDPSWQPEQLNRRDENIADDNDTLTQKYVGDHGTKDHRTLSQYTRIKLMFLLPIFQNWPRKKQTR